MESMNFIYSDQLRWRMLRHVAFWLTWFLFQLLLYSFSPSPALKDQPFLNRLLITWPETLIYILPSMFLAFTLMYFVIPWLLLPGKYALAALCSVVLVILTAIFSALLSVSVVDQMRHMSANPISPRIAGESHPPFFIQFGSAMLAGLRGSITVGGVAAAIKLMKCFYEKQQDALILEKEKVHAELQMLKAQLHPHFLFNTLNNIYSFTQDVSERASGMIMGLSQLLRYILYECAKPKVPLGKELKMISDYIVLESARYDHGLDLALDLPKNDSDLQIAPLLLLPFIENAFKHGASQMMESPWISLAIMLKDEQLSMTLVNGKPVLQDNGVPGIGIANVRKRLDLIYPDLHELQIVEEEEMYVVNLKLMLEKASLITASAIIYEPAQKV